MSLETATHISDLVSTNPASGDPKSQGDDHIRLLKTVLKGELSDQTYETAVASSTTTDIGAQNSAFLQITGTTTITSFGTNYKGPRFLRFAGALTLTYNATSLILPGGANITTAAGDTCVAIPINGTGWYVANYTRGTSPSFSAYQSAAQSLPNVTPTKIIFQAEDFDRGNCFDATTNYRFQPTVSGDYQITATVSCTGLTTVYLYKNGSEFKRGTQFATTQVGGSVSALVNFNGSTDYVEIYAAQSSGSTQNTNPGTTTHVQGFLVRS